MKVFILTLLFLSSFSNAEAISKKIYSSVIVSEVTSIYDGDTFRVNIEDFPDLLGYRIAIRVNGIDTPEIRTKCKKEKDLARKAKQYTVDFLHSAKVIELRNTKRGKYFRIVADVYGDNKSLAEGLVKNALAVPYDGGTKTKDWCK